VKTRNLKKKKVIYHILSWAGIYLLWVLVFRRYSISLSKTMTIEFCYLIFITADYYAITNFIVPEFLRKKKYFLFEISIIVVIALSAWLRSLIALQMNHHVFTTGQIIDFGSLYINSIVNISIWVLLVTIGKMLIDKMQTQQQLELLERERVKSELDYLKAQINPHALFNSLNTIYGHIDKSNQVARNILLQFSELLRYQLYDCAAEKVCLEKELEYVKNYVAFQRLRKDEKLVVCLNIGTIAEGLEIAPLLLVVLIENAFKFASNFSEKENKIGIKLFTENKLLHCCFFNTKELNEPYSSPGSNGIGIANLKRRLELLYPDKYKLTTDVDTECYETTLILDLS
jgi:two-component system LytT family sensor kinase